MNFATLLQILPGRYITVDEAVQAEIEAGVSAAADAIDSKMIESDEEVVEEDSDDEEVVEEVVEAWW